LTTAFVRRMKDWPDNLTDAAECLRDGSLTVQMLTRHYLDGANALQPALNAFITITEREALTKAEKLDDELRAGRDRGPLHGIPIVHKDNFDTAGIRTTVGSELYRQRVPERSASVVVALDRAGAVLIGKANMNEFAAGPSGTNKAFGDVHNPWNVSRSPGGTSSGTGVAVAAGLCLGGTGTDTGGSIRIPAGWCGTSGIRPSFGRVSVAGVYPRAPSLDCAGPIAGSAADLAVLLNAMTSHSDDARSSNALDDDFTRELLAGIEGIRIGIIDGYSLHHVDDDVGCAVEAAIQIFEEIGAQIKHVTIPLLTGALDYNSVFNLLLYEFKQAVGHEYYSTPGREMVFGPVVNSDMRRAEEISADFYESAIATRKTQIDEVKSVFAEVDVLVTPTMPTVAPLLTTPLLDFDRGRQFMLPFGFLGLPALSIPCGFGAGDMPVGVQIIGDHLSETLLLRVGNTFQLASDYHRRRPPTYWRG
jgi:aspartyl-tRNA(Asn)/glutamyl-tRNA(Gln) amidotransferase subunit A